MKENEQGLSPESSASQVRRVRYAGKTSAAMLTHGRIYDVLSVERKWYRIIDDTGEDYLYPPECFDIVE